MTEHTDDNDTDAADDEQLEDVTAALESTGFAPEDDEAEVDTEPPEDDESPLPGPLGALESLQGTGKDIDAYADSPIAEAVGPDGSKGAMHIARGIDGLSPLGAMNPVMDIFIGIILLSIESKSEESNEPEGDFDVADDPSNPGYERRNGGEYDDLT